MIYVTPKGTACTDRYAAVALAQFEVRRVSLAPMPLVLVAANGTPTPPTPVAPALPVPPAHVIHAVSAA
ncbi:hypothetical protein [Palleronia sp.]|uniref:hypothetical protein n=1 Tax=Palleronia sp. TaxID=1940284 RepID=UPI0035C7B86B